MADYVFDVLTDTANATVSPGLLFDEIEASSIGRSPDNITVVQNGAAITMTITFNPALSGAEETVLNGVVAAHTAIEPVEVVEQNEEITQDQAGAANGVATLDAGGKIPASQLPASAQPAVYVRADFATLDAITGLNEGDEGITTDTGSNYVYDGTAWVLRPDRVGVLGPDPSTDNAIARYDGVTGGVVQNSGVTLDDSNNLAGIGNISLSGTVDGRDVNADGSKLDGIEAGAQADQLAAEVPFIPSGDIAATDVQNAIQEVRDDADAKLAALELNNVAVSANDATPGNLLSKLVAGSGITLAEQGDGANESILISAGGTGAGIEVLSVVKTGTQNLGTDNNFDDITFDSTVEDSGAFTFDGITATCVRAGTYVVAANGTIDIASNNARTEGESRITLNDALLPGTLGGTYHRQQSQDATNFAVFRAVSLQAGDELKVQSRRVSGNGTLRAKANAYAFTIFQPIGPEGPQGPAGLDGGGVRVQNDGADLTGTQPKTELNFTGDGVVASGTGSTATVTVQAPVFGQNVQDEEDEAEINTTSGTPVPALTLTTPALPAGRYRIGWYAELKRDTGGVATSTVTLNGTTVKFSDSPVGDDANEEFDISGFAFRDLSGVNTIVLNYYSIDGGTVRIRRRRLEIWRVS